MTQALRGEPLTVFDDGRQTRCFTYVADTIEGTMRAATIKEAAGHVFNIGSNRETSVVELAQLIQTVTGTASSITHVRYETAYGPAFEETRRRVPDVTRAREILNFEALTPLEEGLRQTLEWFRGQGVMS
jgi:UDP-glucose 4-epimerase